MLILPSRGRPDQLARFFATSAPRLPGLLMLDEDDVHNYRDVAIPNNWRKRIGPRLSMTDMLNLAFKLYPNEYFYGLLGDDITCAPARWDIRLGESAGNKAIAYGDDGIHGQTNCCFPFLGGDLVRAAGWIAHPAFGHLYTDTLWREIGKRLDILRYHPAILTTHHHWATGRQPRDATARERRLKGDKEAFERIMQGEIDAIVERVSHALEDVPLCAQPVD